MSTFRSISKSLWIIPLFVISILTQAVEAEALDCNGCHGTQSPTDYRPVDTLSSDALLRNPSSGGFRGNHRTHIGETVNPAACVKCHPGSDSYLSSHRNGSILLSPKINNSPLVTSYNNRTTAWLQTATPTLSSCISVNCHFEKDTPTWGGNPSDSTCDTCHTAPPSDGAHGKKHGLYFGTNSASCAKCHANHLADANTFAHATSAGKHPLVVQFTTFPNNSTTGSYTGDVTYPKFLPSQTLSRNGTCNGTYCHSDGHKDSFGNVGAPNTKVTWSGGTTQCFSCHKGRSQREFDPVADQQISDNTYANCSTVFGHWSSSKGYCKPFLDMSANGHHRLVGQQWVRKYPCYYCHNATVDKAGNIKDLTKHLNKTVDIQMAAKWKMGNRSTPSYNPVTKVCNNVYCHSDGTTNPEQVRPAAWTDSKLECNACHGHPIGKCSSSGCHDGKVHLPDPKLWTLPPFYGNLTSVFHNVTGYHWPEGQEWKSSLPMFANEGAGTSRANSHPRHLETNFTCDKCHNKTVISGTCTSCHASGIPSGKMSEVSHINAKFHVDTEKTVDFSPDIGGDWDKISKKCTNTSCHPSIEAVPIWGGSVDSSVTCLSCHGTPGPDVNDYNAFNKVQGKINTTEWAFSGHGRYSSAINPATGLPYGNYPKSLNPAPNFPLTGNPCWYCHDSNVIHSDPADPYRLKMHVQYERRFEKECVYCHMVRTNAECISCHVNQSESLSPQATSGGITYKYKFHNLSTRIEHTDHTYLTNCIDGGGSCHTTDSTTHNVNAGVWTADMKADVKNQYMMMGVCLQCHDDDSSNQCTSCHIAPESNPNKYSLGYDPGSGFIKPKKARASAGHFGYKHYKDFTNSGGWLKHYTSVKSPVFGTYSVVNGTWPGGKFCWDCHDPHGDSNIYMVQKKIATSTDGFFGIPKTFSSVDVVFTDIKGKDYAVKSVDGAVFNGVCNVCHSPSSKHFTSDSGDGHNINRRCTVCHQHRFADSHADKLNCNTEGCHRSARPIPKHTAFGLPRDCTKCHAGPIGKRVNIMGQMNANSHHVQGVEANNKHCYACHWEATAEGMIDNTYHTGYNYKNYSSVKDDVIDLVIWKANGVRPTFYSVTSAITFRASLMSTDSAAQRTQVGNISNHCLSCHSDQNNDADPFKDCKTPRQYAWDLQSIGSRYSRTLTTTWGKYSTSITSTGAPLVATNKRKKIAKAYSAHGKATLNAGGYDAANGLDDSIPNTRAGSGNKNVECYDCHNSHGSMVVGTTSSYTTFNGTQNGANLKETKPNAGGYTNSYYAAPNAVGVNPYSEGAGQCFDCHNTASTGAVVPSGKTPWGYNTTFGATAPIMGYKDTAKFANPGGSVGVKPSTARFPWRDSRKEILGGHLMASKPGTTLPNLAKASGSASSGSFDALTDSFKNWSTSTTIKTETLISTGGALFNPWYTNNQSSRKPASGVWGSGITISRIHIVSQSQRLYDFFTVKNVANTQLWSGSGVVDGWVDITPTAAGIYTEFTSNNWEQVGVGGDVPEVVSTATATVSWPSYNKWADFYVLMTSGSNSGLIRKITGNTNDTLTFEPFDTAVAPGDSYKIVPYTATVGGLCTPCHDPHGVSTQIPNQDYAVPLLKGTWMTSPYKEDQPPPVPTGSHIGDVYAGAGNYNGKARSWGNFFSFNWNSNHPTPTEPITKHYIDRNTFGGSKRISEKDDKFAGLCMNCHPKPRLTDNVKKNNGAAGFKTVDRVHESVKGWGANSEHSFTCSKCHQTHNSGLPRLMQTDCLDYPHRGGYPSGGQPWAADKAEATAHGYGYEHRGFPFGSMFGYGRIANDYSFPMEATTACHVNRFAPAYNYTSPPAQWPQEQLWNNVTPWSYP